MTALTAVTGFEQIGKYRLNITTRLDPETLGLADDLTFRTISMWLYVASKIEAGAQEIQLPEGKPATPEAIVLGMVDGWFEPRVTVWGDLPDGSGLTVHSNDHPANALQLWLARQRGIQMAKEKFPSVAQPATPAPKQTAQPPAPQVAAGELPTVENAKAAKAHPNSNVMMRIAAIGKAVSRTGVEQYELYSTYGGRVGQHPEVTIYADNEKALESGLVDMLKTLNLKPGDAPVTYPAIATVYVQSKDDKTRLYVNGLQVAS